MYFKFEFAPALEQCTKQIKMEQEYFNCGALQLIMLIDIYLLGMYDLAVRLFAIYVTYFIYRNSYCSIIMKTSFTSQGNSRWRISENILRALESYKTYLSE